MSYQLKCQNMVAAGDGTMRKCGQPAPLCECPDGFQEHPSASIQPAIDLSWCKCGKLCQKGYFGLCRTCTKELGDAIGSQHRSMEIGQQFRAGFGNPWGAVGKGIVKCHVHLVRGMGGKWIMFEPTPESAPILPKVIRYRVGQELPNLPTITEIEPADIPQTAGQFSKRSSRPIHNG